LIADFFEEVTGCDDVPLPPPPPSPGGGFEFADHLKEKEKYLHTYLKIINTIIRNKYFEKDIVTRGRK
jgi:hypothetical protein